MPVKRKKSPQQSDIPIAVHEPIPAAYEIPKASRGSFFSWRNLLLLVIIVALLLLWRNRNLFLAAKINGGFITRYELNNYLNRRFGKQGIDNLISEKIILEGTRKQGIVVSSDEIDARVKEIETQLNGMSLTEAIEAQGMDEAMFRRQLEIQLAIEKMFSTQASVSAQEIDDYLKNNPEMEKQSTDTAKLKENVQDILKQQKITQNFDGWFQEQKNNSSIEMYL